MKIALPFVSRDDFKMVTALFPKPEWPATYDDWIDKINKGEKAVKMSGNIPIRIKVEPAAFKIWCERNGRTTDTASIQVYIIEALAIMIRDGKA